VALRSKILVQFSELVFFVALECQIFAALAKAQPAQPPLRILHHPRVNFLEFPLLSTTQPPRAAAAK